MEDDDDDFGGANGMASVIVGNDGLAMGGKVGSFGAAGVETGERSGVGSAATIDGAFVGLEVGDRVGVSPGIIGGQVETQVE